MLYNRSALVGVVAGLTTAFSVSGLAGCQKKDEESPAVEVAENAPDMPAVQSPEELDAPLAQVDDVVITVRQFQEQLNRQSPYVRARYSSKEQKLNFLDSLVSFEVMAKEAERRGLHKDPEVVRTMKQVMIQKLMKQAFTDRIKPEDIPNEELRAYYDEHLDHYQRPAQVRAAGIVMKDEAEAKKVGKLAKAQEGKSHVGFRDLVMKHSVDEDSKNRGGDLGYFDQETTELPKPVVEAAFGLEKGKVTGPIDAGDGTFYIIKITSTRPAMNRSYEEVRRQILNRVYRDKRKAAQEQFIEGLKKKSSITLHEENLDKVELEPAKAPIPGAGHGKVPYLNRLPKKK